MGTVPVLLSLCLVLSNLFFVIHASYVHKPTSFSHLLNSYRERTYRMLLQAEMAPGISPSPSFPPGISTPPEISPSPSFPPGVSTPPEISPSLVLPPPGSPGSRVHRVTTYGADPTGKSDSTDAIMAAIADAFRDSGNGNLMPGIADLGGAQVHLEGGVYRISRPLRFPAGGGGNFVFHAGSLRASDDFPKDRHLIELWPSSASKLDSTLEPRDGEPIPVYEQLDSTPAGGYEDITLKDLMLDSNFRGGGIAVISSLRTTVDNCYITHFTSDGILVQGGHETYVRTSFIGQHITDGGHPKERDFSGTGINIMGNDNAVTDVVIFSASVGIRISGQANIITGVHCYNKATGWGGIGISIRSPGLTQTRVVSSYFDYTGIVAEDPVQLEVSSSFFLGDAFVQLKSVKGVIRGVNIVDNMFSGSGGGDIVQLEESSGPFTTIDQVIVDRNNVRGMSAKSTVARGSIQGNGTTWTVDFSRVLLFPNLIGHVQYAFQTDGSFANHAVRNMTGNKVVVESDKPVPATIYVSVDQSNLSIR